MIRIIRKVKYRGKCDACGIVFSCEKEDFINVQISMNEFRTFVECPDCGEKVRVEEYTQQIKKGGWNR